MFFYRQFIKLSLIYKSKIKPDMAHWTFKARVRGTQVVGLCDFNLGNELYLCNQWLKTKGLHVFMDSQMSQCTFFHFHISLLFLQSAVKITSLMLLLRKGDQILEVDSVSLHHAALSEAHAVLRDCGPGLVRLVISRHRDHKVGLRTVCSILFHKYLTLFYCVMPNISPLNYFIEQ